MKVFLNKEQFGGEQYFCLLEKSSALAPSNPSPIWHLSHCDISSEPHSFVAIFSFCLLHLTLPLFNLKTYTNVALFLILLYILKFFFIDLSLVLTNVYSPIFPYQLWLSEKHNSFMCPLWKTADLLPLLVYLLDVRKGISNIILPCNTCIHPRRRRGNRVFEVHPRSIRVSKNSGTQNIIFFY